MRFDYAGDNGCPIASWFGSTFELSSVVLAPGSRGRLSSVVFGDRYFRIWTRPPKPPMRQEHPSWLGAKTMARLTTVDGKLLRALDIYTARCGVIHTSIAVSDGSRAGTSREVWYQFQGQSGVNLGLNSKLEPTIIEIEHFAIATAEGGTAFIGDLNRDSSRLATARGRALNFFRWGAVRS